MKERNVDIDLFDTGLQGEYIDRLGKRLIIIENPKNDSLTEYPFRSDTAISVIILSGAMACVADMAVHNINEPGMLVILPSQTVEKIAFSEDFEGYCLIMSQEFLVNLPMGNKIPLLAEIRQHGFYPMTGQMLDAVCNYMKMLQGVLRVPGCYQYEIATHLTIAYYYGLGTYLHKAGDGGAGTSRYELISHRFMELVRENCPIHRDMEFYADALCLSAKHVNLAVRTVTGVNAMKWIERYTVLKAKSLLKTTSLSVSEISDRLNFPTPSDFGKYFKKFTGFSPKAFRTS